MTVVAHHWSLLFWLAFVAIFVSAQQHPSIPGYPLQSVKRYVYAGDGQIDYRGPTDSWTSVCDPKVPTGIICTSTFFMMAPNEVTTPRSEVFMTFYGYAINYTLYAFSNETATISGRACLDGSNCKDINVEIGPDANMSKPYVYEGFFDTEKQDNEHNFTFTPGVSNSTFTNWAIGDISLSGAPMKSALLVRANEWRKSTASLSPVTIPFVVVDKVAASIFSNFSGNWAVNTDSNSKGGKVKSLCGQPGSTLDIHAPSNLSEIILTGLRGPNSIEATVQWDPPVASIQKQSIYLKTPSVLLAEIPLLFSIVDPAIRYRLHLQVERGVCCFINVLVKSTFESDDRTFSDVTNPDFVYTDPSDESKSHKSTNIGAIVGGVVGGVVGLSLLLGVAFYFGRRRMAPRNTGIAQALDLAEGEHQDYSDDNHQVQPYATSVGNTGTAMSSLDIKGHSGPQARPEGPVTHALDAGVLPPLYNEGWLSERGSVAGESSTPSDLTSARQRYPREKQTMPGISESERPLSGSDTATRLSVTDTHLSEEHSTILGGMGHVPLRAANPNQ